MGPLGRDPGPLSRPPASVLSGGLRELTVNAQGHIHASLSAEVSARGGQEVAMAISLEGVQESVDGEGSRAQEWHLQKGQRGNGKITLLRPHTGRGQRMPGTP